MQTPLDYCIRHRLKHMVGAFDELPTPYCGVKSHRLIVKSHYTV